MENFFNHKNIIITGGASGIGASLAKQLSNYGANVIIIDRSAPPNEQIYIQADMADFEQANQAFDQAISKLSQLDYVINSAGIFMGGEIRDTEMENWRKVIDNNIYAVIHGAQLAYGQMIKQGSGHIINVASTAGLIPVPGMGIYGASKYALVGLSHEMRLEAATLGVKVSVACPTIVNTPLYDTAIYNRVNVTSALAGRKKFQTPDQAAKKILVGIRRNQATIHTATSTKLISWIYRFMPTFYRLLAGRLVKIYRQKLRLEEL